jgi:hypothetical protein
VGFKIENQLPLEAGLSVYNIRDQVQEEFQKRGFIVPPLPQQLGHDGRPVPYHGDIPHDLTQLSDQQLGQLMTLLSLWMEYVGGQLALADMARTVAKTQLEFTEATIRLTYRTDEEGKKRTVQERDDMVQVDKRYVEAKRSFMYLEAFHVLVENVYKAAKQNYSAVSRRVTQRGQEIEQGGRTTNVGNMPAPGNPLFHGRRP